MTAEIAIINKMAIALAADSAGTVRSDGSGAVGSKIHKSVNKLFMLSKYYPVGIMIYDNAAFMGIPWESLIKNYRNDLDEECFNTLKEYAENFTDYLNDNDDINSIYY